MATRHGRLDRTPTSRRDPAVLAGQHIPAPRLGSESDGNEHASREKLHLLAQDLLQQPTVLELWRRHLCVDRILDWLETFPGDGWQDRWPLSGADTAGNGWGPSGLTPERRGRLTRGLTMMVVVRAVRPSYAWLTASRQLGMFAAYRRHNHAEVFSGIEREAMARNSYREYASEALNALTRMAILTGRHPHSFDVNDFEDYAVARRAAGGKVASLPMAYELLRDSGGLSGQPSTWRQAQHRGQLTVPDLVDRYPVANREMRDVLVHYLVERSAGLDYASLVNLTQVLTALFWGDLERHHPGISSLHLPEHIAQAWKQRVRVLSDGRKREGVHTVLMAVRAFYLDLRQWAIEEPQLWAQWVAPCPVRAADVRGYIKEVRRRQARMQQRTRTLIPVLPRLITAAEQELQHAQQILATTQRCQPGDEFTVGAQQYRRVGNTSKRYRAEAFFVIPADPQAKRFDAERLEENAFWTLAAIEVMRRTGCRIEELLELTHLSLRQYQAPTGEMVPLLQISPSKTDQERVIPADPDLVSVLARIIRRIKNVEGRVPLLHRYDSYERGFGPLLPHLFQCSGHRHQLEVISASRIREQLKALALRANISDIDGSPLSFTPHDFRRVFATATVASGLPIHIAAKILGHLDLNTTQGYVAVYPEQVITHYRQFVDLRRTRRPSDEYREPSDQEWGDFRDHFHLRKVALGQCDRPYGTPCQHESACIRCPMLRLDITQVPRLLQIEHNHHERLEEARSMQWLGEVAAIEEGLRHIETKKRQADRLMTQAEQGESGPQALE